MAEYWTAQSERGTRFGLILLVTLARVLGRWFARLILHAVVIYYLLTARRARMASRKYLRRVLGRKPRWSDQYRHMYYFASATLDRIYMFRASTRRKLQISRHGYQVIRDFKQRNQGAILLVAHLGSFEMLRGRGSERTQLRVLMDRESGAKANAVLSAINPSMQDNIIDTSEDDVDRVLKVKEALDRGELVGLMADRLQPGERTTDCRFLGKPAPFPLSPWLLAGITHAPVLLAFGLYRGGNRYELHFEQFSEQVSLTRGKRDTQAHEYAQAYVERLEHYVHKAPYNWFNFYDFWYS